MNEDYVPIACHRHDEFEIAIMRRRPMPVEILKGGAWHRYEVLPLDTSTREGAEYLEYRVSGSGVEASTRLDRIRAVTPGS